MATEEIQPGDIVKDTISGFKGMAIAATNWLHGCRRITIQPQELHEGKPIEALTFDEPQLEVIARKQPALLRQTATGGPRPEPARRATPPRR